MMLTTTMVHEKTARFGLSLPNVLLRVEGLTVLVSAIILYAHLAGNGWLFVLLLLTPDLAMVGYLVNPRVGSWAYNAAHLYTLPALLLAIGMASANPVLLQLGLIWCAHIGMDRTVGYGLKYPTAFKETHLQRV